MGRISNNTKEQVRERIDMVALVSEYVTLTQRGPDDFWGRCPFHEEKSASFHIRPGRGLFKCFGCGKGGDIFRFVEELEGIPFREALTRLARRANVEIEASSPQEREREERRASLLRGSALAAKFFEDVLWSETPVGAKGRAYLEQRGIKEETARAFGIGVAPDGWGGLCDHAHQRQIPVQTLIELGLVRQSQRDGRPYDFFRDRLMFPIRDEQGKVVAFGGRTLCDDERKYMNSPEVPGLYEKRKVLYGLDQTRKARPKRLVIVEGYLDVVIPHQVGRTEFVAALGTAFTPLQAKLARRYVDEVVLLFDADDAGANATLKALANLVDQEGITVKVARLPDGLDPDEAVQKDPALLDKTLEEADDLINFIMAMALRDYSLASPVGQERAIRAAIRLLARIPNKIRLSRELETVAARFGLPEKVLRDELSQEEIRSRTGGPDRRPRPTQHPAAAAGATRPLAGPLPSGAEVHLLEALLAVPDGASRIAATGGGPQVFSPGPCQRIAGAIFALAQDGPVEPAVVMGRLEDPTDRALCDRLIGGMDEAKNYEDDLAGFDGQMRKIQKQRLKDVTRRIKEASDQETKKRLLAEKRQLRAQLQPGPTP